jgi:hypothetical protein
MGTLLGALILASASASIAQEIYPLKAGAAKVDITPPADALPKPFTSIHDHLFARAIFLDNGHDRAILMNADLGGIGNEAVNRATAELSKRLNVPVANILISATHDHSAIFGANGFPGIPRDPRAVEYNEKLPGLLIEAGIKARDAQQPAKIGYGTGMVYLNTNRDAIDEKTRLWAQEPNRNYPSDKTLAVVKIEAANGDLIAVYMNYAMHAISLFLNGMVSGDFPGEAERYIEREYNDKAVAIWTSGAAGDQNPLYVRANGLLANERIKKLMAAEHVDLGTAIMHAMFAGNPASDNMKLDPALLDESLQLVKSEGQIIAEETIRVMNQIRVTETEVQIEGTQETFDCPGRNRLDTGREGEPGRYEDAPSNPVHIKIGALRIGDIAFGSADAEIYNMIGQEVKQGSKLRNTLFVTLTNGQANSGYVPTDDAFGRYTFQVLGTRLKPGCAEPKIADGIDDMIAKMH